MSGWREIVPAAVLFWFSGVSPSPGEAPLRFDLAPRLARSFDDDAKFYVDADGDGRRDEVTPRELRLRRRFIVGASPFPGGEIERYVAFALDTTGGRHLATLLQFRFGTENGGYRSYILGPLGDADGDGRGDLAFWVGGELPEELVVLLDRGESYEARSTGPLHCACAITEELEIIARDPDSRPRALGGWDAESARFTGSEIAWIVRPGAVLRAGAESAAEALVEIGAGSAIRRHEGDPGRPRYPGWIAVSVDGVRGWIEADAVSDISPFEID